MTESLVDVTLGMRTAHLAWELDLKSPRLLAFSANFSAIPCHQSERRNDSHQVHKQAIGRGERVMRVRRKRDKNDSFASIADHQPHRERERAHAKRQHVVIRFYYSCYTYPYLGLERKLVSNLLLLQCLTLMCAVIDCTISRFMAFVPCNTLQYTHKQQQTRCKLHKAEHWPFLTLLYHHRSKLISQVLMRKLRLSLFYYAYLAFLLQCPFVLWV